MVPRWFEPTTSREDAIHKLQKTHNGSFLIRQSSQPGTLALSLRTGAGEDDIQHFIIISRNGSVALEDSDLEFDSLVSLVNHYSTNRDELPVSLKMSNPTRKSSAPGGFNRGDSPYVSMVGNHGRQRTKSTIWVNSPVFRTTDAVKSRDQEVIQSVLQQGSNLQDSFSSLLSEQLEQLNQTASVTSIRVNQSEEKDSANVADDDYEDYSLPIDVAQNLYEEPETPSGSPNLPPRSPDLPSRLSPSLETNRRLSYLSPHRQLEYIDERLVCDDRRPANDDHRGLFGGNKSSSLDSHQSEAVRPRFRKNNSVVVNQFRPSELQVPANVSKSCSNIFEELEKRNEENKNFRGSFVRKVSLNLSIRRNNNIQPIRKLSAVMKKIFPLPKSFASLINSQENSDSWEYLADCGVSSPLYEEVKDVQKPSKTPFTNSKSNIHKNNNNINNKNNNNMTEAVYCDIQERLEEETQEDKISYRSGSCDSLYESEYSESNPTSIDRNTRPETSKVPMSIPKKDHVTRIRVGNPQPDPAGSIGVERNIYYV